MTRFFIIYSSTFLKIRNVKSHVGIVGNEIADKSGNEGHHISCTVVYKLTREECFSDLRRAFLEFWDVYCVRVRPCVCARVLNCNSLINFLK